MITHHTLEEEKAVHTKIGAIFGRDALHWREVYLHFTCEPQKLPQALDILWQAVREVKEPRRMEDQEILAQSAFTVPHVEKIDSNVIALTCPDMRCVLQVLERAEPALRRLLGEKSVSAVERYTGRDESGSRGR